MALSNEKKVAPGISVAILKHNGEFFIQKKIWNETTMINQENNSNVHSGQGWKTEKDVLKSDLWKLFDVKK